MLNRLPAATPCLQLTETRNPSGRLFGRGRLIRRIQNVFTLSTSCRCGELIFGLKNTRPPQLLLTTPNYFYNENYGSF